MDISEIAGRMQQGLTRQPIDGSLLDGRYSITNAFNFNTSYLDASNVHGIITSTQSAKVRRCLSRIMYHLHFVTMSPQNLSLWPGRHVGVVASVVVAIEEPRTPSDAGR